jgi:hypothetical protein
MVFAYLPNQESPTEVARVTRSPGVMLPDGVSEDGAQ